jgi:hypothetical protein
VLYQRTAHSGTPAIARNVALREVRAPFVAFFDADDVMLPGHLSTQKALLLAHPDWVAVTADFLNFSSAGPYPRTQFGTCRELQKVFKRQGLNFKTGQTVINLDALTAKRTLAQESFFINGSVLYRTAEVLKLGGFDETLQASEDFDLFWRTAAQGRIGVSTFCAFRRRLHAENLSNNYARVLHAKILSRSQILHAESDRQTCQALKRTLARTFDALATLEMPLDRVAGTRALIKAFEHGWSFGVIPFEGARAWLKSWLLPNSSQRNMAPVASGRPAANATAPP